MSTAVREAFEAASEIIDRAYREHQPSHVFGMYSGGHDSLVSTHVASTFAHFNRAVHINTTIGIAETRRAVRSTSETLGWNLLELFPPRSYRDICLEHGMPGPGAHLYCYTRLKERCIEKLVRDHKRHRKDRIMIITGVRAHESKRRMGNVEEVYRRGAQVWVAPCIGLTSETKEAYIAEHRLPRNPVVDEIGMSGECLCGSFAEPGEFQIVADAYPETGAEIREIQAACAVRGVHAQWGVRPQKVDRHTLPLCFNCEARKVPA